jgi:rsbT co-antagonist protein RsbR
VNLIETVAEYFQKNAESLAIDIVNEILSRFDFEISSKEIQEAQEAYITYLGFLGYSILSNEDEIPEGVIEWSKQNGEREALLKGKVSGVIMRYPATRQVFIERFARISIDHGLSTEEILLINKRINYVLDISIHETILAFERFTDKIIKKKQEEVNELSAPIVPIQDGIAVLPLIGSFGFERADHLVEKAVARVAKLNTDCIIIDFSGLITIDADVANQIFNIHNVFRLLGIKVIITGMRPELAQTAVSRGIDFSLIDTYANVKQAIESIEK